MSRYVYKPLTFYIDPNNKFAMKEFLELYKNSLESGELLVDLREYDIYIANNGIEYPIPIIKTLREEVINWIESEDNPINILSKLDNGSDEKKRFDTIKAKTEKIKELMKSINESENKLKNNIDDSVNTLMRAEREVRYFYTNLSSYLLSHSNEITSLEEDIGKIVTVAIGKMIEYYDSLQSIYNKLINYTFDDKNTKAVCDLLDKFIDMRKIINMTIESKNKLNKDLITKEPPQFKIDIKVTRKDSTVFNDSSGLKEDTEMNYFKNKDLFDYNYKDNTYTITLGNEGGN